MLCLLSSLTLFSAIDKLIHASTGTNSDVQLDPSNSTAIAATTQPPAPTHWNPFSNSLFAALTIKIDRTNFLAWKSQVVPTVIGHDLDDTLFTGVPPPQNLVIGAPNPQYLQWKKSEFSHIKKGSLSISDYVDKVQMLSDSITTTGSSVGNQDVILQLLNGLGPKYDPVVSGITSRSDELTLEEFQALLMAHESHLDHHNVVFDLTLKMQVNLAFGASRTGHFRPPTNNGRGTTTNSQARIPRRGSGRGSYPNSKLICQACMKSGHVAAVCHYRVDKM
uniref:Retrotransposon Copia-like N-terminal domain-containing protein n=1 Tax=Cannabis sativa TaxID=3483 RepID=A0A803NG15_CANSA